MLASDYKSHGLISAALLAVVVSLVGLAGAVKIAQTAVTLGPAVGDIVQFDPRGYMPIDMKTQIDTTRTDAKSCMLDLATIHRSGGSLIVEERLRVGGNPRYRVHWAGTRSADGAADCGPQDDLVLDDSNRNLLALAAGGWGVVHTPVEPNDLWRTGVAAPRGS